MLTIAAGVPRAMLPKLIPQIRGDGLCAVDVAMSEGHAEVATAFTEAFPVEDLPVIEPKLERKDFATPEARAKERRKLYMRRKRTEAKEAKQMAEATVAALRAEQEQLDAELIALRTRHAELSGVVRRERSESTPV